MRHTMTHLTILRTFSIMHVWIAMLCHMMMWLTLSVNWYPWSVPTWRDKPEAQPVSFSFDLSQGRKILSRQSQHKCSKICKIGFVWPLDAFGCRWHLPWSVGHILNWKPKAELTSWKLRAEISWDPLMRTFDAKLGTTSKEPKATHKGTPLVTATLAATAWFEVKSAFTPSYHAAWRWHN